MARPHAVFDRGETEPHEIIYFKLYKSQIPVVEQALETAALMLGTDYNLSHKSQVASFRESVF